MTITREQFFEFVKNEYENEEHVSPKYFLKYFDNYEKTGKMASWNLAALLWLFAWFFYRGMYFYGLVVFLLLLTPAFLVKRFHLDDAIIINLFTCVDIVISIVCMMYANYFYLRYANQKISNGYLNKGTNIWAALIAIILCPIEINTNTAFFIYICFYLIVIPFVLLHRNRE